jgi:hypothetical protein
MALVEHGYSNPSSILPCILGYALWSYLYHILIISRGLHEFKSIFTKKFPEKNFHYKRLHMYNEYEIRSLTKDPILGTIVSYGSYPTERAARKALKDLSTRNFANASDIRSLGLELIVYVPMVLDRISALDMEVV